MSEPSSTPAAGAPTASSGAPVFPPVVIQGLKPQATLGELLKAMEHEAAMHGLAAPWGVSLTAELLMRAAQALQERAGEAGLEQPAVPSRAAAAQAASQG